MGVFLDHGVSLYFSLLLALETCWATFKANNSVRSAPAFTLVLHQAIMCIPQIVMHLCSKGERNGAQRETKVSFGRTMMQALHGAAVVGEKAHLGTKQH